MLTERRTELVNMRERLLNGYLAGAIEEAVFQAKDAELERQIAEVEELLGQANQYDPEARLRALALFDFSKNMADIWNSSNTKVRREILDCISLNRTVSTATLCMPKRKPFDFLAEKGFLKDGRGDRI